MKFKRNIKYWFQRRTRGWSDDETWNLDYAFIKWVNSRFKKYKEQASATVDLDYHRFEYKRKEYTQLELIDKVIELSDKYLNTSLLENKLDPIKNEIFDIFKLIFWTMWW
ncbi:MAG: hypothetical protein KH135_00705 [Firmicutes bacterium]|nr:hypothetical protein [Bacillota bacterium]